MDADRAAAHAAVLWDGMEIQRLFDRGARTGPRTSEGASTVCLEWTSHRELPLTQRSKALATSVPTRSGRVCGLLSLNVSSTFTFAIRST